METIGQYLSFASPNNKTRIQVDYSVIAQLKKHFYVVSLDLTGPSLIEDRITKIDAVEYKNGTCVRKLMIDIEDEQEAINRLVYFLGDALSTKTPISISNVHFQLDLLCEAFKRYHISYNIRYFDMLSYSRKYLKEIDSFKEKYIRVKEAYIVSDGIYSKAQLTGNLIMDLINE